MVLWFLVCLLVFLLVVFVALPFVVPYLEQTHLFQPHALNNYDNLTGTLYFLPNSGGAVLHVHPKDEGQGTDRSQRRKIVFLHGNGGSLSDYHSLFTLLDSSGYDVYGVEYVGFGMCWPTHMTIRGVLDTVREAWQLFADNDTILIGFSIGGIVMGQLYQELFESTGIVAPQMVFLNTFGNLPYLVHTFVPEGMSSFIVPFMETQNWITSSPPSWYTGQILIVTTEDDRLIPPVHSYLLGKTMERLDPVILVMPNGGHELGIFLHMPLWYPYLLPPKLDLSNAFPDTQAYQKTTQGQLDQRLMVGGHDRNAAVPFDVDASIPIHAPDPYIV